jgi:formylglycine-generating enzyme required for sulfatase activity
MTSVSIIHAPRDEALGEKIAAALASAGHAARRVSAEPNEGDLNGEPSLNGNDEAAIVVWTEAAAKLARLHQQAGAAMARGALIPVAVGGARPPGWFEDLTPVDLSGWTGAPDDPRWRFVLEEVRLAQQRTLLKDGDVWAAPAQDDDEEFEFHVEEFDEEDEPEIVEAPPAFLARPQRIARSRRFSAHEVAIGASAGLVLMTVATWFLAPTVLPDLERRLSKQVASATGGDETMEPAEEAAFPDASATEPATLASLHASEPKTADADAAASAPEGDAIAALIETETAEPDEAIEISPAPETDPSALTLSPAAAARNGPLTRDVAAADEVSEGADDDAAAETHEGDAMRDLIASLEVDAAFGTGAPETAAALQPAPVEAAYGDYFRDCADCPDMASLPAGTFRMGAAKGGGARDNAESPILSVALAEPFALGARETTYAEWDRCVADGACRAAPDFGWGRGDRPVVGVSHADVEAYLEWLSQKTGKSYRLPTEAEWEYAARAGGDSAFAFGPSISVSQANFNGKYPYGGKVEEFRARTTPVGSFEPNAFGLYDMHGNAWEWTADCWNATHGGAPTDGSAATAGDCTRHVLKGGAWNTGGWRLRSAHRIGKPETAREFDNGFRVARDL